MAALSLLSITSHHNEYNSHNSLSIHNSNLIARNTPALPEQRVLTFPHGTRVTVRDLFGSMPVRVKQRALELERSGSSKTLDQLVLALVAIIIAWPGDVSIYLRDASSHQTLTLRTAEPGNQRPGQRHTDTSLILSRTPRLLAQASLYDGLAVESWVPIGASAPGVSIGGCVCLLPVATKRLQFLAIGIEPFLNEYSSNFLYEEINRVFANSAFGVSDGEYDPDGLDVNEKDGVPKGRDLKTRKDVDRWPIFYLQIALHGQPFAKLSGLEDLFDNGTQGLTTITDLLRVMSYEFLKKHHFRPKPVRASPESDFSDPESATSSKARSVVTLSQPVPDSTVRGHRKSYSPFATDDSAPTSRRRNLRRQNHARSRPTSRSESPFDLWSKVKAGRSLPRMPKASGATEPVSSEPDSRHVPPQEYPSPSPIASLPTMDTSGRLLRKPFDIVKTGDKKESTLSSSSQPDASTRPQQDPNQQNETVIWVDPMTKIRSTINTRTGFVVNTSASTGKRASIPSKNHPGGENAPPSSPWIRDILSSWKNPAFCPTEPPIPRISGASEAGVLQAGNGHACSAINSFGDSPETSSMHLPSRISGNALRQAEIIGQVDMKFILAKVSLDATGKAPALATTEYDQRSLLVLIDQHAADERCRVESLMQSYFSTNESGSGSWNARTEALEKPLMFELSNQEGHLLRRYREHFEHWGVMLKTAFSNDAASDRRNEGYAKVEVRSLPPSILERCRLEPRLVVDLLRKEIWKLHDEPSIAVKFKENRPEGPEKLNWVRMFHGCPQGILDLINSRSCRSKSKALLVPGLACSDFCQPLTCLQVPSCSTIP